jgi:hypothetical protein
VLVASGLRNSDWNRGGDGWVLFIGAAGLIWSRTDGVTGGVIVSGVGLISAAGAAAAWFRWSSRGRIPVFFSPCLSHGVWFHF